MLQRMRELAVQAANGTNSEDDRLSLDGEYKQLAAEASRTLSGTKFNGTPVLSTSVVSQFQVGAGTDANLDQITVAAFDWTSLGNITSAIGVDNVTPPAIEVKGSDSVKAIAAITALDNAIKEINTGRATFGAVQNRFDNVVANLMVNVENQTAARSRIMDADYASETSNLSRASILQQAGNAMVAQANQLPQQVLALLR